MNRRSPDSRLRGSGSLIRGHSVTRALARCWCLDYLELTAKSAVRLLLGLAIWFSKTEPPCASCGLCATLAASSRVFFNRGAESFIRSRFFCQAPLFFGASRLLFALRPPASASGPSFEGERLLLQRRVPCQPCRFRLYSFVSHPRFPSGGARLLPPPRWESTTFVNPVIPSVSRPRFPSGGARLLPPPRLVSTVKSTALFRLSAPERLGARARRSRSREPVDTAAG